MTNAELIKRSTSRLLLAFVLVTIGFAAGRRTAPAPATPDSMAVGEADAQATRSDQVVVSAAHMTFRCHECNQIEWLARELVENEFAVELADGRIAFRTVDYMRDTVFARKYNISSSTIVVARVEGGKEQEFKRLDEVWTKLRDRDEFLEYVRSAIRDSLQKVNA